MTDHSANTKGSAQTLTFAEEYVLPVLKEEKTATVRYPVENEPIPGDELHAETPDGTRFATLEVTRTGRATAVEARSLMSVFGALHGTETIDELIAGLNEHYDDSIGPGTMVQVLAFEVVHRER